MNAIFLTEKEALDYIYNEFGYQAAVKRISADDSINYEIDEVPFTWDGEVSAFEVDNGEALVAFLEDENVYTISFGKVVETTDSLYRARKIIEEMIATAEDLNVSGTIVLRDEIQGEIDSIEIEQYLEEEAAGTSEDFFKSWMRLKIGRVIREERHRQCLSIRKLAELSGMSKNNVERIEGGLYNYTIDNLNSIISVLNLSPADIFGTN